MFKRKVGDIYRDPPTTAGKRRRDFQSDSTAVEAVKLLSRLGIESIASADGVIITPAHAQKFADILEELVMLKEMNGDSMVD
jgi:hypothetical protein